MFYSLIYLVLEIWTNKSRGRKKTAKPKQNKLFDYVGKKDRTVE